jgi:hypothetical protein
MDFRHFARNKQCSKSKVQEKVWAVVFAHPHLAQVLVLTQ